LRRSRRIAAASALRLALGAALVRSAEPSAGTLTERVVCRDQPGQAYSLYTPASAAAGRPAPVLYLLDARGRALLPIERFRAAADSFGWILVSSYNSRSDTKDDPNTPALQAMWNDTHARLAIDPRRTYVGGFSGGARVAAALAAQAPRAIAGVVACGAGLPDGVPARGFPVPWFGTCGDRDFNYYEMRALDAALDEAKAAHRIAFFDGGHEWPPPDVGARALAWLELQAMRSGSRPGDEALAAKILAEDLAAAEALERAGDVAGACRRSTEAAEDARGLADTGAAAAKARALCGSDAVRKATRDAERRDARDRRALETISSKIRAAARNPEIPAASVLAAELGIPALKGRAAGGPSEERLSAERLLANLRVEAGFYLPEELLARGDAAHARLMLSVAVEIDPDEPRVYYNLASAEARSGQNRRALHELDRAVAKGFRRFDRLEADPDFARLREDPEFRTWLAAARARSGEPSSPTPGPAPGTPTTVGPG
jgi:predicted esterase